MAKFEDYTQVFFWDFKRMDNVNYNWKILIELFALRKGNNSLLNKAIIVITISIIECIIYDFICRIKEHTRERIPNLNDKKIYDTKTKEIGDKFGKLISHAKKHNYLQDETIYDKLDKLRKIRNRVHIQDMNGELNRDEEYIWTDANVKMAGKTLKLICKIFCEEHPRIANPKNMDDFPELWK